MVMSEAEEIRAAQSEILAIVREFHKTPIDKANLAFDKALLTAGNRMKGKLHYQRLLSLFIEDLEANLGIRMQPLEYLSVSAVIDPELGKLRGLVERIVDEREE